MGKNLEISVGMPVFNGERYIGKAIESILNQTLPNFELVVVDNASTDTTREIVNAYSRIDDRVSLHVNSKNIGAAKNYNATFAKSRADFFRWHNSDDLIAPNLHERCLEILKQNPSAVLAAGTTKLIDENDKEIGHYQDNLNLQQATPVERFKACFDQLGLTNVIYGLMRRAEVGKGPLFGDGKIPAADVIFIAVLALQGKFIQVDEPLFYRRMHNQSSSAVREDDEAQSTFWSGRDGSFNWVEWRIQARYWKWVYRLDARASEKIPIYKYLLWSAYANKRELIGELCWPLLKHS